MVPRVDVNFRRRKEALEFAENRIHPELTLVEMLHHPSSYTNGEKVVKGVLSQDNAIGR